MPAVFRRLGLVIVTANIGAVGGRLALLLAAKHLGASPIVLGLLIGLFSLPGALTSVWVGRWFDRHDARRILLGGIACVVAAAALVFARHALDAIFVASLLYGFGINVVQIGVMNLTGEYSAVQDRIVNYNRIAFALSLSLLFGPTLAGFSIDHLGFRAAFLVLALIPLPALVLIAARALPPRASRPPSARGAREAHVLALLREAPLRRLFTLELLFATGWDALSFLVPLYGSQIGLSASAIGTIAAMSSLATMAIRLGVPWMARRLGPWRMLTLALLLTSGGYLAFPFFVDPVALGALAFLIGAGLGIGNPVSMTLIYELSPAGRAGELIGLRMATMRSCHTVLPFVSGNLGAAIGVAPVFWVFGVLIFGGAWAARRQARPRRPKRSGH